LSTEYDFIVLIKANERIIHKVIGLYVYHEEDKKDLYQEILLQAWKSFANFKGTSKFSTWLYKVSLHTALSFKRRDKPVEVFE
jgi:RNA polymerase sigma factor (sigma-70 family)